MNHAATLIFTIFGAVALMPLVLLALYSIYIQHERGGWWDFCWLACVVFYPFNMLVAHTVFPLAMWRKPRHGEIFVSRQIAAMLNDTGWRGNIARRLAYILNTIAPSGDHFTEQT